MQPSIRSTVRILLIDESDRLLLLHHEGAFHVEDFDGTGLWAPPGGGLEDGETHEAAGQRELWEETGLREAPIGPCVWRRDVVFTWDGVAYDSWERYHVCHVPNFAVDTGNQSPYEQREITGHHWWSQQEIAASNEVFVPRDLADLLLPLLKGEYPDEPLQVGI
jgi:8-oxo-dGTP pyrophosphatase MutT (NUDIX family)